MMLTVFAAGSALADQPTASDLRQPLSVQQVAFEYDSYLSFAPEDEVSPSPSDAPAVAETPAPAKTYYYQPQRGKRRACRSCNSCGDGFFGRTCCCGNLPDPWTIGQPCALQRRGITVGGWFSAGVYANEYDNDNNGPLGFNNVGNEFTSNQNWIYLSREADTGGYGVDWGFRFDYVFGVDGPDTQAFGDQSWDFGWNSTDEYGSAIPQLYFDLAIDDLTIRMGHFYTPIGYEVVPAPNNFFYSHSYTMYYGEPFTHTGFLMDYAYADNLHFYGGWTAGWDTGFSNDNDASTFLGGIAWDMTDRASLAWMVTFGEFGYVGGQSLGDVYGNSIVFTYELAERLTYVLQHDLGVNDNLGVADSEWYGLNQYLLYKINECWGAGLRFEWFRDDDGARVPIEGGPGNAGDYYALTAGLNWRPHANITVRPELRYDWYDGSLANGAPFDDGTQTHQFSGGFDFIVTF